MAIAEKLGDRESLAEMLQFIGHVHSGNNYRKAQKYLRKASEVFQETGALFKQGNCLDWLGNEMMYVKKVVQANGYYEQAIPLLEAAKSQEWAGACRASLEMIGAVGEERFLTLIRWASGCIQLEKNSDFVLFKGETGCGWTGSTDMTSPALFIINPLWQVSHMNMLLKTSMPPGECWSGEVSSFYGHQSLAMEATVTVQSDSETVAVPAGSFTNCLMTEQITTESNLPDDAPEERKQLHREVFCGTRRAWYAPGAGLVQLHVRREDGAGSLIQLTEYSVSGPGEGYLPLAPGNSWTYGWANVPEEYAAKEVYKVVAREGNVWFLEHYSYCYRTDG
ncbi:MAG: hypothetical protein IT210_09615 [Armatimonadetes bacterium]|nr:hypothetical protein [Armatimonadota bacterium]